MAYGALASAESGYDIPSGVNPLAQLHKREMVLPERYADVIRGLDGNSGGTARPVNLHFNIQANDGASVKRMLMDHKGDIASALKAHLRSTGSKVPVN